MSDGTTISMDTSPVESARKKYVCTWLNSWISPIWSAGTCAAVTVTLAPGTVRFGVTASVVACVTTAHTPMSKSSNRTAARPIIIRRRDRLGAAATVGGGDG